MAKKSQPKKSAAAKRPEIADESFEPPSTGPDTTTNPPPLIDRPPFDGGDEKK